MPYYQEHPPGTALRGCFTGGKGQKVMDDLLQQGISAYLSGQRAEARRLFATFLKLNINNEAGWGWLFLVCESDTERRACLKQILRIHPENEKARRLLRINSLPEAALPAPAPETPPEDDPYQDPLAKKVTRFLVIFQGSALLIGSLFIFLRLNSIALAISFVSLVLLAGALIWFFIRYLTEATLVSSLAFPSFLRRGLASRRLAAAVIGAFLILSPVCLGIGACIAPGAARVASVGAARPVSGMPTLTRTHSPTPALTEKPTLTAAVTGIEAPSPTASPTSTVTPTSTDTPTSTPTEAFAPTEPFIPTNTFILENTPAF